MSRTIHRQAGFSIISLMIASAIGIFLIGGAGKIYLDSKNAFNARTAIAVAAENSRFALQDLRRYLVMAGRGVSEMDDTDAYGAASDNYLRTFPAVDPDGTDPSTSTGIIDQDDSGNSAVAIRYGLGPAPCGEGGTITTTHTVRFYRSDGGELVCQSIETVAGVLDLANVYERPLLSGVISMRVLYGIDTDIGSQEDQVANQYVTAAEVDDAGLWINVVAIRIGIVMSSDTAELPYPYQPADAEQLSNMGMDVYAPDNSHVYKAASATIVLRNLNTVGIMRQ